MPSIPLAKMNPRLSADSDSHKFDQENDTLLHVQAGEPSSLSRRVRKR